MFVICSCKCVLEQWTRMFAVQSQHLLSMTLARFAKKFNDYCTCVPNNIGFDDTIPTNYCKDVGFSSIINKYYRHPSIVELNRNTLNKTLFQFERINSQDVKIINCFDCMKAPSYDKVPLKLVQKCAKYIAPDFAKLINASFQKI